MALSAWWSSGTDIAEQQRDAQLRAMPALHHIARYLISDTVDRDDG
jgi:hypothetical protein